MATGGTITFKFEGDTKDLNNKIEQTENKVKGATSTIKDVVIGMGLSKIISSAMGTISNSIDDAVSRVDTLNNFPKVMSNLGIESDKAQKSIDKMSDKLAGLPTTLDQGASAVQRFTSANGDVEKSTDIFLALNNAILAGGASSDIQASALEQLSQAYSRGKPDMNEWRTAMTAMPAQLKQVATAMGYVSADELGEALRNGTVSMDEFMGAITNLNEEGIDGFANFEEQARSSTGGIGTSITVAKTQIVKGVADIIGSINQGLADANLPSISEIIATVGKEGKKVLDFLAEKIPPTIKLIKDMIPLLETIGIIILAWKIGSTVQGIVQGFQKAKLALALFSMQAGNTTIAQGVMNGTLTATEGIVALLTGKMKLSQLASLAMAKAQGVLNAVMSANPIALVIATIIALVAGFVLLYNKCEWFRNGVNAVFEFVKNIALTVFDFLKNNWQGLLLFLVNPFAGAFKLLYDNCGGFRKFIDEFVAGIKNAISDMGQKLSSVITSIKNSFNNAVNTMKNIGLNIVKGIGNGITSSIGWLKNQISSFVGDVTSFIKKMFKIGSPSKLMANEVGQWLPKGIAVGIDANTDSVTKAMDGINSELLDSSMFNLSPNMIANASANYNPSVNVNVQNNMSVDPLGQVVNNIKTFSNGAKNDYNYGM